MPLPLIALAIAAFGIGTTVFIWGILSFGALVLIAGSCSLERRAPACARPS